MGIPPERLKLSAHGRKRAMEPGVNADAFVRDLSRRRTRVVRPYTNRSMSESNLCFTSGHSVAMIE